MKTQQQLTMTSLGYFQDKLRQRLHVLESAHRRLLLHRSNIRKIDRCSLQQGLVSALWQAWNDVSRSILLNSAKGAVSASGVVITSTFSQNTFDEIRFAAMRVSKNQSIGTPRAITGDYQEPNWGDLKKVNRIILGLRPTNSNQLLSAFGSMNLVSDLQKTRNACAHISLDRIKEIYQLKTRYVGSRLFHPSDVIFWVDPNTNDFVWNVWIDEMKISVNAAVA